METVVFVEVLDRRGRVRERTRLDSFPATIGRAYTNSVIVDDSHVCPEHVRIAQGDDGALFAEDLGSVNGLYREEGRARLQRIEIGPDTRIRIGHTTLRFRGPAYAVPPALAEKAAWTGPMKLLQNGYVALALFLLSLGALMLNVFLSTAEEFTPAKVLGELLGLLLLFAVWAGIWSFVNRLVAHRFRFLSHLGLAGVMAVLFLLLKTASEYYAFLFPPGGPGDGRELALSGFVFFLLLFGHLSILSSMSFVKRLTASLLVAVGIFGAVGFREHLESKEFSNRITFSYHLKPLDKKWLHPASTEAFFKELQPMKAEIEHAAAQE